MHVFKFWKTLNRAVSSSDDILFDILCVILAHIALVSIMKIRVDLYKIGSV